MEQERQQEYETEDQADEEPLEGPLEEPKDPEGPKFDDDDGEPEPVIDFVQELELFYAWLKKEPYLPRKLDEEILITFLWDTEVVEEAEAKLMNYYYARQSIPQVFHNRHPCSPKNLAKYDAVCVVPLTPRDAKKWIIFATWLAHTDPTKFSPYHQAKLIFTELDILLQENQIRGKTISIIVDMEGYTEQHTDMITKYAAKRICNLFTECFPAKFNGFYIIHPPDHIAEYTGLFAPFDFHLVDKIEDLPGFLPKRYLTSDLGGEPDAPTRNELFQPFFRRMRRCGNWLAYEEFLRTQEMYLRITTTRAEWGLK